MPKIHYEALLFCCAWTALALAGGLLASWWVGILLSVGLMAVLMPTSAMILSKTEDEALERNVRWGILMVAAAGLYLVLRLSA